jgi:hypothetical protein
MWTLEVYDGSGNLLADLSSHATGRVINQQRNSFDTVDLTFDLDDITSYCTAIRSSWDQLFAVGQNEIRIKKNDAVITAGQVVYARPSISKDKRDLTVKAYGWLYLLGFRYAANTAAQSSATYTAWDSGALAWDLISTSQAQANGNLGINQGTIQTSQVVNRLYSYKNIKDAIIELSQIINGFDFEITWNKVFNVYWPKIGSTRDDIVFTYPGNVTDISFERDGTKITNRSIAVGSGTGVKAARTIQADTTSQAVFGLRERVDLVSDQTQVVAIQQKADANVLLYKSFLDMPDLTVNGSTNPQFGTYRLGDVVLIQCDHPAFATINGYFRIDAMTIALDENDFEQVRLRMMK